MRCTLVIINGLAWGVVVHMVYLVILCLLPFEASGAARLGEGTLRSLGL